PTLRGQALAAQLPGAPLPDGAIALRFPSAGLSQSLEVRVTYAEPCGAASAVVTLPIQLSRGQGLGRQTVAKIPDGVSVPSPVTMQMRGIVDAGGTYRFPTVADGPGSLAVTAATVASTWKFQPYRANGVAFPVVVVSPLMFTTTGAMTPPGINAPPPSTAGAPPGAPPPPLTSTTVNGKSTEDFATPDVPALTPATSACAIARESTYAFNVAVPIKIGGGDYGGPARERRYLQVLRGPEGQGLHVLRRGSLPAGDGTILDLYELTYAGLSSPLRIYLDEYHEGVLQAPAGLVCAAPIVR
ncbi:MAG TPA: hypothetical protein VFI22_09325, partial [Thermomicrobiales bacterium]|nr:hypothetical protein [Thermomicrobiales bacterium]